MLIASQAKNKGNFIPRDIQGLRASWFWDSGSGSASYCDALWSLFAAPRRFQLLCPCLIATKAYQRSGDRCSDHCDPRGGRGLQILANDLANIARQR